MGSDYCVYDVAAIQTDSAFFGEHRPNLTATIMISIIILVIGVPLTFAVFILQHEGRNLFIELQQQIFLGIWTHQILSVTYRL